jgi:trehalose synthase
MWKRRPVVGSRVGGIQDQVEDGVSGILIDDPHDLAACAAAVRTILGDPDRAEAMGEVARQRVIDRYLAIHRLREYVELLSGLIE